MPRSEPAEHADFPVHRVQAVCANADRLIPMETCGRTGWTRAVMPYAEGTVISTPCSDCVERWQAKVAALQGPRLKILRAKPERKPLEHKPHWTDKLP